MRMTSSLTPADAVDMARGAANGEWCSCGIPIRRGGRTRLAFLIHDPDRDLLSCVEILEAAPGAGKVSPLPLTLAAGHIPTNESFTAPAAASVDSAIGHAFRFLFSPPSFLSSRQRRSIETFWQALCALGDPFLVLTRRVSPELWDWLALVLSDAAERHAGLSAVEVRARRDAGRSQAPTPVALPPSAWAAPPVPPPSGEIRFGAARLAIDATWCEENLRWTRLVEGQALRLSVWSETSGADQAMSKHIESVSRGARSLRSGAARAVAFGLQRGFEVGLSFSMENQATYERCVFVPDDNRTVALSIRSCHAAREICDAEFDRMLASLRYSTVP